MPLNLGSEGGQAERSREIIKEWNEKHRVWEQPEPLVGVGMFFIEIHLQKRGGGMDDVRVVEASHREVCKVFILP